MHITSCSRDSRETLKYGTFGRKKLGFRAMSQRILKLCVASLLNILCFPDANQNPTRTRPGTRTFNHYPTQTRPEVKKPYSSRPGPMWYGNSQWNEMKNFATKKPDAKQCVFKFGLEISAFRIKSNKLNWWSHLCGIMAKQASSRNDHPNMSTLILSFSKYTLQIL